MNVQRGFTLIEALVAMTIIAVALIACLKAAGNLNIQQDDMIKRQYAQWSAKSTANFIRVAGYFPMRKRRSTRARKAISGSRARLKLPTHPTRISDGLRCR